MRYAYFDSEITGVDEQGMPIFDRAENSEMFAMIFAKLLTNGVLAQPGDCFQVVASGSGMNISVRPGFAMIKGRFAYEEAVTNLEIEAAPKQYSRIDRVVLRCNYLDRLIELVVKTGTSGASPVAPELEQPASGDYYELGLATVRVTANQTVLSQSAITDTRGNSSVCGYVTQLIDHIDTEEFYKQLNSFYSEFVEKTDQNYAAFEEKTKSAFDKYSSDLNDYIDSMERNGSSALTGLVNSLSKFRSDAQTEFNQWFANVQGQLGEDAAGNLMNTANDHETRLDSLENMVLTNNFTAPIDTGDSNVLVDEEGNAIVADWQFMEKTAGTNNSNKGPSENPYEPSGGAWVDAVTTGLVRYYIDGLNGNDSNKGTREAPFKTLDPIYKIMNQGHCNLRIALAGGSTYEFKAFTLANTHIHFSLWGTGEPILKFVPVYSTDPTKTPDEFAFYNCHINCKGVYDEKTKTTRYFRVQCSTNKMYFDSGNLALTYVKIEKIRISFYQSGGLILNSSIDAVRSIGSNVRIANSIIGAIDSYASVIGIEGCTIYANRTTEHNSSAFWHLSGGNFYLQGGGTTINGTPGVANFISAVNAMISIAAAIGSGTSFKQFSGSITIQCGMMSITQGRYNALKALAKTTSINSDKTKPDVLLISGISV